MLQVAWVAGKVGVGDMSTNAAGERTASGLGYGTVEAEVCCFKQSSQDTMQIHTPKDHSHGASSWWLATLAGYIFQQRLYQFIIPECPT